MMGGRGQAAEVDTPPSRLGQDIGDGRTSDTKRRIPPSYVDSETRCLLETDGPRTSTVR